MVKRGSSLNFTQQVQRADNIRKVFLGSVEGKKYTKALQTAASEMAFALREKDFDEILTMEMLAVQRDFHIYGTEQAQSSESGHMRIMERWTIGCDPDRARQDFVSSYSPENLPKAKVMDPVMKSLISTQCRRLSEYAKGNTSPAEKLYFTRRAECLKAVYKEHMRHLEQALGQGKALGKGLER